MVRNSFINRKWGLEDRYGKFDFRYNQTFEIIFLAEHEFYKIAVNGVHIGVFRHRLPLNLVNFINVKGDVEIEHILLEQDMQSAQSASIISALSSSQPAYVPITITPAATPLIQISYQPPRQNQVNPIHVQQHFNPTQPQPVHPNVPYPIQQQNPNNFPQPPPYQIQPPSAPYNAPPPPYDS